MIWEKNQKVQNFFIGPKIFKDNKLSVIISEEYKFWKFISGKKFLNENSIAMDEKLLKNFIYLEVTMMLKLIPLMQN